TILWNTEEGSSEITVLSTRRLTPPVDELKNDLIGDRW
ncbi:hypothetical protein AVEN_269991-1, partial [Araneus ventricosus]